MRWMLGDLLRAYRKERRWLQKDLAEATGLSRSYIGLLEQGRRGPSRDQLEALIKALDLNESPKERQRFLAAGVSARADQDKDLKDPVQELREEVRLNRAARRRVVEMLLQLRDAVLKAGVKLPQDLLDNIERVALLP